MCGSPEDQKALDALGMELRMVCATMWVLGTTRKDSSAPVRHSSRPHWDSKMVLCSGLFRMRKSYNATSLEV